MLAELRSVLNLFGARNAGLHSYESLSIRLSLQGFIKRSFSFHSWGSLRPY